jgi:hypothetical protein
VTRRFDRRGSSRAFTGIEQLPDFNTKSRSNVLQPRDRRRVNPTLYQADEIHRIIRPLRKLFLGKVSFKPEMGYLSAKQSIKMGHTKSVR